jgi:hypothetical protein
MDAEGVLAARLAAQRLFGPPAAGPLEVARHLLAVQAQDARAARLAIRARSADGHSSDVDRTLSKESPSMCLRRSARRSPHRF